MTDTPNKAPQIFDMLAHYKISQAHFQFDNDAITTTYHLENGGLFDSDNLEQEDEGLLYDLSDMLHEIPKCFGIAKGTVIFYVAKREIRLVGSQVIEWHDQPWSYK